MSMNASIETCKYGSTVIVWSVLAMELLPTLPTPLRMIIRAFTAGAFPMAKGGAADMPGRTASICRHGDAVADWPSGLLKN
jgi:hypothetical protein